MAKVGILTINDDGNYGNRLQNYAVQEILTKKGHKIETISNQENIVGINVTKKKIKYFIKKVLGKKKFGRYLSFMEFNKNIKFSKYYIDKNHIPDNFGDKYDFYFTGSDQVWNPNFGRMSDIDFLKFAPNEKRNSFSASFGITQIPEDQKEYYKNNLLGLIHISVREDAGKKIIEELTGRKDVQVLLDPTMLLTAEEWDKVAKRPEQLDNLKKGKYILNYFLGELSESRKQEINRIAEENGCDVINILDKNSPFYQTGPSEFLYLEKNAFLVSTDSFHSSVFAILYNTPFIVFNREDKEVSMNSRIETLLNKFNLNDRYYKDKITDELLKCDYTEAYKILDEERKKSDKFLEDVFKENDG